MSALGWWQARALAPRLRGGPRAEEFRCRDSGCCNSFPPLPQQLPAASRRRNRFPPPPLPPQEGDDVVINAHVPLNDMFGYSTSIRSMTQAGGACAAGDCAWQGCVQTELLGGCRHDLTREPCRFDCMAF